MKINNYGTQGINPYKKQVNKIDQVKSETVKGTDKIEISSAAKELQQVTQVSQARTEKIEALKKEIQNGTYQVRTEDVASSIVNFYTKNNQAN